MENVGSLISSDPIQLVGAWIMLMLLGFFPVWIIYSCVRACLVKQEHISFFHPAYLLATCLNVGKLPKMPGTWGTLFTMYLIGWLVFLPRSTTMDADMIPKIILTATIIVNVMGIWVSDIYSKCTGRDDPKEVVIDEMGGMLITASIIMVGYIALYVYDTMTYRPLILLMPGYAVVGFLLFRLFDVWKPWIIGKLDRTVKGGLGIMLDDMLAGLFAGVVFWVMFFTLHFSGIMVWLIKIIMPEWVGPAPTDPLPEG